MERHRFCPHCGSPLVDFCQHCGKPIPATDEQITAWPRNIASWSFRRIVLLWLIGVAAVFYALSLDKQYIGVALPAYFLVLFGIPYGLVAVTRKWRSSRR
jgi:hypothetical protein